MCLASPVLAQTPPGGRKTSRSDAVVGRHRGGGREGETSSAASSPIKGSSLRFFSGLLNNVVLAIRRERGDQSPKRVRRTLARPPSSHQPRGRLRRSQAPASERPMVHRLSLFGFPSTATAWTWIPQLWDASPRPCRPALWRLAVPKGRCRCRQDSGRSPQPDARSSGSACPGPPVAAEHPRGRQSMQRQSEPRARARGDIDDLLGSGRWRQARLGTGGGRRMRYTRRTGVKSDFRPRRPVLLYMLAPFLCLLQHPPSDHRRPSLRTATWEPSPNLHSAVAVAPPTA